MKLKALILLAALSLLTGCGVTTRMTENLQRSYQNIRYQHTDEELAIAADVNSTLFREAERNAVTRTGRKVFGSAADGFEKVEAALRD